MKIIYIDSDYKCHTVSDGNMNAVETNLFDGKCDTFIEGYTFIPYGESWTRSDGVVFHGEMIAPWKDFAALDAVQRNYEQQRLLELENKEQELNTSYNEGINSI